MDTERRLIIPNELPTERKARLAASLASTLNLTANCFQDDSGCCYPDKGQLLTTAKKIIRLVDLVADEL